MIELFLFNVMGRIINYEIGEEIANGILYIAEGKTNNHGHRTAILRCTCSVVFETSIYYIRSGNTKGCGCKGRGIIHGLSKKKTYKTYQSMMQRCYNKKNIQYDNYGGRGIGVSDEMKNVVKYIEYVESLPNANNKGYSIDRIDNSNNYSVGNLRWATRLEQNTNIRVRKDSNTPYTGISKTKSGRYASKIAYDYKRIHLGRYDSIKEALGVRTAYIIANNLPHKIQEYKEK